MATKAEVVARYLPSKLSLAESAEAFAPSNIALCKYWGKRQKELNLPINSSLSVSLAHLGTTTKLSPSGQVGDQVFLNGELVAPEHPFAAKISSFIDLWRRDQAFGLRVDTRNNIPTAAGLASSASGFAALTLALDKLFQTELPEPVLSMFARMGSGSASRSLWQGFVQWDRGELDDGSDSFAAPVAGHWPDLRIGLVKVATGPKAIDSRSGMQRTVESAALYQSWPTQAERDLGLLLDAIEANDFDRLGQLAEQNAMSMHATMIASWPPLLYWTPESVEAMQKVWQLRQQGMSVYFTMDAGPNLKLLFEAADEAALQQTFPELEVVAPFGS